MSSPVSSETCTWCDADVPPDDGFRVSEPAQSRRAVFCRLEHIVPWAIQGGAWGDGTAEDPPPPEESPLSCAHCERALDGVHVLLVRHRGPHRIRDDFCSAEHLVAWAKAGGRWQ
jgi:hypothetical protein